VSAAIVLRTPGSPTSSRIRIARGALAGLGRFTRERTGARRAVVVSDGRVSRLYGARAVRALRRAGVQATLLVVPAGERSKRVDRLERLWISFARIGLGRRDAVIALGGGVVGDLAGFAAATWLRGVPWIAVPTTVLAQADSSVGGKTGVDLAAGKNLVGAFHAPAGVLVDPALLATLSRRQRANGLAEVVKTGFAVDRALFVWAERHARALASGAPAALEIAVTRSIRAKARVVRRDEREREGGARTALNFGHTLGHALEAAHDYRGLLHGEAIAVGMRVAASLSVELAGLKDDDRVRLERLLDQLGLPARMPPTRLARLRAAMERDKKRAHAGVRWVLTPRMGHASVPRLISGRRIRVALLAAGALP
jgi:3-dehydroquinate synthase